MNKVRVSFKKGNRIIIFSDRGKRVNIIIRSVIFVRKYDDIIRTILFCTNFLISICEVIYFKILFLTLYLWYIIGRLRFQETLNISVSNLNFVSGRYYLGAAEIHTLG